MLFGITQGGLDQRLRAQSANELIPLDFPGYAIGGLSVGESREATERMMRFAAATLPADKPRYLMGVGTVRDVLVAIDSGVDMFDCVYPTRCGRNGRAMTRKGELHIKNAAFTRDFSPLDPDCDCQVCKTYTRAYLIASLPCRRNARPRKLLSYHNVYLLVALMRDARNAIIGWILGDLQKRPRYALIVSSCSSLSSPARLAERPLHRDYALEVYSRLPLRDYQLSSRIYQ